MNLDKWGDAFDDAIRNLGVSENDFKVHSDTMKTDELVGFINEFLPKGPPPKNVALISRIVTVMAYVLAEAYPDENIRKLFAGFCQALISYGRDLEITCDDKSDDSPGD